MPNLHYCADDLIYVQVCTGRTKFGARWPGPCTVMQVARQQNYFLRNDLTTGIAWYHVNQLHPLVKRHSY